MEQQSWPAERQFRLRARDGIALACRKWYGDGDPRHVLVVAHGMGEHCGRYRAPLAALVDQGASIYALDHRGHGLSAAAQCPLGSYGPGGFAGVVDDLAALVDLARDEHPGLPLVLFGHSMGSMIAQAFLLDHRRLIDGLILCGSAAVDVLARAQAGNPMLFAAMNDGFAPARTPFDWLTRDPAEVDAYIADPLCGLPLEPGSFADLLGQGARLADRMLLSSRAAGVPVLLVSGEMDPLHRMLDGLTALVERYRVAGVKLEVRLYPGARHELLNEINRGEIVADIADWIASISAALA
jgi:alpha-beta hydrolase superfamily lysophospholipase